jgi:hypothetical protein
MTNKQLIREVKNEKGEIFREYSLRDEHSYNIGFNAGIEKGKLEQKKEEFAFLNGVLKLPEVWALVIAKRLKQLQKEIGEDENG